MQPKAYYQATAEEAHKDPELGYSVNTDEKKLLLGGLSSSFDFYGAFYGSTRTTADGMKEEPQFINPAELEPWSCQTLKWLHYPNTAVHDATFMLSVAAELFFLILVIGWSLTLMFQRKTIYDNPILHIVGYNNVSPCPFFALK